MNDFHIGDEVVIVGLDSYYNDIEGTIIESQYDDRGTKCELKIRITSIQTVNQFIGRELWMYAENLQLTQRIHPDSPYQPCSKCRTLTSKCHKICCECEVGCE